jgi:hypothetical protein
VVLLKHGDSQFLVDEPARTLSDRIFAKDSAAEIWIGTRWLDLLIEWFSECAKRLLANP